MRTLEWFYNINKNKLSLLCLLLSAIILTSNYGANASTYEYSTYKVEGVDDFDGIFPDETELTLNETSTELKMDFKYQWNYLVSNRIFSYLAAEKLPDDQVRTLVNGTDRVIYFSFCNDNDLSTWKNFASNEDRSAVLLQDSEKNWVKISASNWDDATVTLIKNEENRNKDYLSLSWIGMDKWEFNTTMQWKFTANIVCNSDLDYDKSLFYYTGGFNDTCAMSANIESKLGCAIVNFNIIWDFFAANSTIFAIVLIVLGFFFAFFGYRILIISLFLAGTLITAFALIILSYQLIISQNAKNWVAWVVIAVSLIIGICVGYVVAKFRRFGIFLLAFGGGCVLGFIINNAFMRYAQSQALFWVVIIGCGAGWGALSCFLYVLVAILSTSLAGSYALVRGISLFVGHFPNEFTIM